MVLESTWIDLVANSTPMVDLESRLNSLRVNRSEKAGLSDAGVSDQDHCSDRSCQQGRGSAINVIAAAAAVWL